jgi:hypothetical protein
MLRNAPNGFRLGEVIWNDVGMATRSAENNATLSGYVYVWFGTSLITAVLDKETHSSWNVTAIHPWILLSSNEF